MKKSIKISLIIASVGIISLLVIGAFYKPYNDVVEPVQVDTLTQIKPDTIYEAPVDTTNVDSIK